LRWDLDLMEWKGKGKGNKSNEKKKKERLYFIVPKLMVAFAWVHVEFNI